MSLAPAAHIKSSQETETPSALAEKAPSPATGASTPRIAEPIEKDTETDPKQKRRSLFGFGKKKTDEKKVPAKLQSGTSAPATTDMASQASVRPQGAAVTSPILTDGPLPPSSPNRALQSSPPRVASPAGSQIFERDVQDSTILPPNSPAIPSHIQVENHIPPALDASSEAITDDHLNPDTVEIITHTSHQPAAVTVTGAMPSDSMSNSWADDLAASFSAAGDKDESASNYGSLDSSDVRRLSFISFADVVQAEHGGFPAAGSRDSMHFAGLTSLGSAGINRSPSPIRSPVSSQGPETSPPNSKSGSIKGLDMSPSRKSLGSPLASPISAAHTMTASGELNIETMSQALRRTGSADLSAARSLPVSPIEGPSR